ncbi:MAG TPA: hypothetical protein VF791_19930 [Pyrinomonadaceae bacterium]
MSSVKGTFQNGIARPLEPVSEEHEGQEVIITFPDEKPSSSPAATNGAEWNALTELLDDCAVDLDTPDLAHEHDYYLYGKPKKH